MMSSKYILLRFHVGPSLVRLLKGTNHPGNDPEAPDTESEEAAVDPVPSVEEEVVEGSFSTNALFDESQANEVSFVYSLSDSEDAVMIGGQGGTTETVHRPDTISQRTGMQLCFL